MSGARFVLVPSPLVGPDTWEPVRAVLAHRGVPCTVAALPEPRDGPTWRGHAAAIARHLEAGPGAVLVAHSQAGSLLPAAAALLGAPPASYLFADAVLPVAGATRLDVLAAEDPAMARELRRRLVAGRRYPSWSAEDLAAEVPDPHQRLRLLEGLRPRDLAFFTEEVPVPAGWPDAPCGYLRFSAPYTHWACVARARGWPCAELGGGHFHALVAPEAVADHLLALAGRLGVA